MLWQQWNFIYLSSRICSNYSIILGHTFPKFVPVRKFLLCKFSPKKAKLRAGKCSPFCRSFEVKLKFSTCVISFAWKLQLSGPKSQLFVFFLIFLTDDTANDTVFYRCVDSDIGGPVDPSELVPRRVGEVIGSTVGTLAALVNYPIGIIK